MPTVYSHKYIREQTKKAIRAAQDAKNAEDSIVEDFSAVIGFNATLQKVCYGPRPRTPPPTTSPRKPRKK